MKTQLFAKIWGVKGNSPSYKEIGACTLFVDKSDFGRGKGYISVDAFQGQGSTYSRRFENEIEISDGNDILFKGTFDELSKVFKNEKEKTRVEKAGQFLIEDEESVEDQIYLIETYLQNGGGKYDLCSHVSGVTVWEPLENTLTIQNFLGSI